MARFNQKNNIVDLAEAFDHEEGLNKALNSLSFEKNAKNIKKLKEQAENAENFEAKVYEEDLGV